MASIPVTVAKGDPVVALVDDADHDRLARFHWTQLPAGYVVRYVRHRGGRRVHYLHREVMGLTHGDLLHVEHVNGDKLDNRRASLRVRAVVTSPPVSVPIPPDEAPWQPDTAATPKVQRVRRSPILHARARSEAAS
jgi:hypothetical protein